VTADGADAVMLGGLGIAADEIHHGYRARLLDPVLEIETCTMAYGVGRKVV
jgi:hypothetical protein